MLQLEFEESFDKIEHHANIGISKAKGFGQRCIGWIKMMLGTATSFVLNGVPQKKNYYKRGVRQGDPLSPLLFVLVVDLLQFVLNKAMSQGFILPPAVTPICHDFPVAQYVDNNLVLLLANARRLYVLRPC